MLRRATTCLLSHLRPLSTAASSDDMFVEAWRRIMPNMDPPKTPLSFMHPRPTAPSPHAMPSKFTVNLVDMVTVPATSGQMGILPGHISSMSELKRPGYFAYTRSTK